MKPLLAVVSAAAVAATMIGSAQTQRAPAREAQTAAFSIVEATIPEMRAAMEQGRVREKEIVRPYLVRLATYEDQLHAAITVNPKALETAEERDRERAQGRVR